MILAFLFDDYDWPLTPVAAILDFANKTVPGGVDLGAHKKSKKYGMDSIWAKFGPFGRIWTKQSIWYPYSPDYEKCRSDPYRGSARSSRKMFCDWLIMTMTKE
jgi:hypothetical protein